MTRSEYMSACTKTDGDTWALHRAYYRQFVTSKVIALVETTIGEGPLLASQDPHFNDIPLAKWDRLHYTLSMDSDVRAKVRDCNDTWSLGTSVCILKEAARILREMNA